MAPAAAVAVALADTCDEEVRGGEQEGRGVDEQRPVLLGGRLELGEALCGANILEGSRVRAG